MEIIEALRYKLRMFGVLIDGSMNIFCNNVAVCVNTTGHESTLSKKYHSIAYHCMLEVVTVGTFRVSKEYTWTKFSDLFTNTMAAPKREGLLENVTY